MLHVTDDNFKSEVLNSDVPVLVDFFADWCGPCKMLSPIVEELEQDFDGKIKVVKLNVDEASDTASTYGVMSIPTLILFKNGDVSGKSVGYKSKDALIAEFNL